MREGERCAPFDAARATAGSPSWARTYPTGQHVSSAQPIPAAPQNPERCGSTFG